MGRAMLIVALVGLAMATGVASASPADTVRHPLATPAEAQVATVVVERGDHLWKISARHVEPGVPIAPYWREVIEVNLPRLRSGDPDLIYPGEVVELPQVSEQP